MSEERNDDEQSKPDELDSCIVQGCAEMFGCALLAASCVALVSIVQVWMM